MFITNYIKSEIQRGFWGNVPLERKRAWLSSPEGLHALPVQAIPAQAHQDIIFTSGNATNQIVVWRAVQKKEQKPNQQDRPLKHERKYIYYKLPYKNRWAMFSSSQSSEIIS